MRIFTPKVLTTAGLVLAVGLLSIVSEHSPPDVRIAEEAPSAAVSDVGDRDNPLITCTPPGAAGYETAVEAGDPLCATSGDPMLAMGLRITKC